MIRCVFCDVYRTILRVGPASDTGWERLWCRTFPDRPLLDLASLSKRCREIVADDHNAARARGILCAEVDWPSVLARALGVDGLSDDFVFAHAQSVRSISLEPGFGGFLELCRAVGLPLGIVSNAQAYTLRELDGALGRDHRGDFEPDLMFWSFQNGFSKPDPHVFQMLTARLAQRGIRPEEALMIGDREDNDIEPARAAGMQVWHYRPGEAAGWIECTAWVRDQLRSSQTDS